LLCSSTSHKLCKPACESLQGRWGKSVFARHALSCDCTRLLLNGSLSSERRWPPSRKVCVFLLGVEAAPGPWLLFASSEEKSLCASTSMLVVTAPMTRRGGCAPSTGWSTASKPTETSTVLALGWEVRPACLFLGEQGSAVSKASSASIRPGNSCRCSCCLRSQMLALKKDAHPNLINDQFCCH
jgi:hypothetical protein